jgi:Putative adhesin
MSTPYQTDPYRRGSALSRSFLPLALITLGVVFLLGNLVPDRSRGGLVVLGLGAAFMVGRLTTGRYGYAVPAGILIALGTYFTLQELPLTQPIGGSRWFFVLLGLGFGMVYVIGLRPAAVWPLFPAVILVCLGLAMFGVAWFGPLASLSWIAGFWPVALVVVGLWLLFRDQLPLEARRPIATLGGMALLGYGLLAAASSVAAGGAFARQGFGTGFGASPFADTVKLDEPIAAGQTFSVNNPNGRTTIRVGAGSTVNVIATRHRSLGGQDPAVRLSPVPTGVSLDASTTGGRFPFGGSSWVEYVVEVPPSVNVSAQSGSGQIEIDGVSGAVTAESGSGRLALSNLSGPVQARAPSGSVTLSNIAGELKVSTNSGAVRGTEVQHLREASASSGYIQLEGKFTDAAKINASSGSVNVKLLPGSAVALDVKTGSGAIVNQGLSLTGGSSQHDRLSGAVGTPASDAVLSIETNSGTVLLSQ